LSDTGMDPEPFPTEAAASPNADGLSEGNAEVQAEEKMVEVDWQQITQESASAEATAADAPGISESEAQPQASRTAGLVDGEDSARVDIAITLPQNDTMGEAGWASSLSHSSQRADLRILFVFNHGAKPNLVVYHACAGMSPNEMSWHRSTFGTSPTSTAAIPCGAVSSQSTGAIASSGGGGNGSIFGGMNGSTTANEIAGTLSMSATLVQAVGLECASDIREYPYADVAGCRSKHQLWRKHRTSNRKHIYIYRRILSYWHKRSRVPACRY